MKTNALCRILPGTLTCALFLSFAACGGKKKEEEKDEVPDKQEALTGFCMATADCEEEAFYDDYDDIDACVEDSSMNHEDIVMEHGPECGDSVLSLLDCLGEAWPATCDIYEAGTECIVESLNVNADCEGLEGL